MLRILWDQQKQKNLKYVFCFKQNFALTYYNYRERVNCGWLFLFAKYKWNLVWIMKHITVLAKSSILLATLIWGTSFVIIKDTLEVINPHYLMAIRFTVAFVVLSAVFFRRMKSITREMIWQGSLIGFFLFLAYLWQTLGIMDTTPGKNAFLTAIYCVMVPFLAW